MNTQPKLIALFAALTLGGAGSALAQQTIFPLAPDYAAPGFAPPSPSVSPMTQRFVAEALPNVNFLDDSSRLALDHSNNSRIRAFALREARGQTLTSNAMVAWSDANAPVTTGRSAYVAPDAGPLGPVLGLATIPLNVAGATGNAVTGGLFGQPLTPTPVDNASQVKDASRLADRQGPDFDALYISSQMDSLQQLSVLYRDYMRDGDDPGLRDIAARQLPVVQRRLSELRAM